MKTLIKEDFSSFKVGDFPFEPLLGAMGEYHYRPYPGDCGIWYDPTPVMGTGGYKMWIISQTFPLDEKAQKKCLEYSAIVKEHLKDKLILATGEDYWTNYNCTAYVQPFLQQGFASILFRYQDSRSFYSFGFYKGNLELRVQKHEEQSILASIPYDYDSFAYGEKFYKLTVQCNNDSIICKINDKEVFNVNDSTFLSGRFALGATAPCRFTDIEVTMEDLCYQQMEQKQKSIRKNNLEQIKKAKYPKMKLLKKINLKNFGTGRNIRFGHLKGGKEWFVVLAQSQMRVHRDAYAHISCLTAIDLNGNILWQLGEGNPKHAYITCDLPFQVYDIDEDGKDEVICVIDFTLRILDGATGKTKKSMILPHYTPENDEDNIKKPIGRYAFDRLNSDGIRICNFTGNKHPSDILLKDRYRKIFAYDKDFNLLWTHQAKINTGHYGYSLDINNDGKEELFIGYDLLDSKGNLLWSLPILTDHTDEIIIGPIDPTKVAQALEKNKPKEKGYIIGTVSGSEGFILSDIEGNIITKDFIGHAQRISTGNFCPELPGNEICVVTFWGNQGIIRLYDCKGNLLWSKESKANGNVITPVSWGTNNEDLILLNANVKYGGLMNGQGNIVVEFPNDNHPDTCCEILDLNENGFDNIIVWDESSMWIYEQDLESLNKTTSKDCQKMPYWNASNYRGEYSYRKSLFEGKN